MSKEQYISGQDAPSGVHWELRTEDDGEFIVPYVNTKRGRVYLADGDWITSDGDGNFSVDKNDPTAPSP